MSAYDFPQRLAKRATRSSSATLALLAISGLAILGLVFVAALWAGKESDAAALDRQRKLVDSRLQDQVDRVSNDLRLMAAGYSSLISASASMSNEDDAGTAQAFATMSKTVFGYNGTFLITPTGDLAFASDPETTRRYKWIRPLLLPMVRTVLHGKEAAAANAPLPIARSCAPYAGRAFHTMSRNHRATAGTSLPVCRLARVRREPVGSRRSI